jgi:anti-sigma factor RsiW
MRDLLPEYAHGVLGADDAARVAEHLDACALCSAELALLGRVQNGLALGVPRMDVAAIVAALPKPLSQPLSQPLSEPLSQPLSKPRLAVRVMPRRWVSRHVWQYAAAAGLVLAFGGGIVWRSASDAELVRVADSTFVAMAAGTESTQTPASARAEEGITFGGGLSDLSLNDLQALLGQMDSVRTLPSMDPESMTPVIMNEGGKTL